MAEMKDLGRSAVYGSLAYDLNHPELFGEEELYGAPAEPEQREERAVRTRVRAQAAARSKQGIAPFALIGGVVAAFLAVTAITAQVALMRLSSESVGLEIRVAELEDENSRLQISYESCFNLAEVENYATTELGMQKPGADQVVYIDTSAPDRAVILGTRDDSFVDRAADFVTGIGDYFR